MGSSYSNVEHYTMHPCYGWITFNRAGDEEPNYDMKA
jgi:hypothetical protein